MFSYSVYRFSPYLLLIGRETGAPQNLVMVPVTHLVLP